MQFSRSFARGTAFAAFLMAGAPADGARAQTIHGYVTESACGYQHGRMRNSDSDTECIIKCVKGGAKFVLADFTHQVLYGLNDQARARDFAGQWVIVKGHLDGDTLSVDSIEMDTHTSR